MMLDLFLRSRLINKMRECDGKVTTDNQAYKPLWLFLLCGILVGTVLSFLYHINQVHHWPDTMIHGYSALIMFVVYACLAIMTTYNGAHTKKLCTTSIIIAAIFSYLIWNFNVDNDYLMVYACVFFVLSLYISLCFIQSYHQSNYKKPVYRILFENVWGNFPLFSAAFIFVSMVGFILTLWSGLFILLGIHYFLWLFSNFYFLCFSTPLFFCMGLFIAYKQKTMLYALRFLLLEFFKILLPVLTAIVWLFFIFFCYKLVVGHQGTSLSSSHLGYEYFYLSILGIIFINAVYQDGQKDAMPSKFYRLTMYALILLLPIFIILSFMLLRKTLVGHFYDQSGIAFYCVFAVLIAYACAYVFAIFQKGQWLLALKVGNFYIAWLILAIALLLNCNSIMQYVPQAKRHTEPVIKKRMHNKYEQPSVAMPKVLNPHNKQSAEKHYKNTQWVDAGPIYSNSGSYKNAQTICPGVCNKIGYWHGQWRTITTKQGRVTSVCQCSPE